MIKVELTEADFVAGYALGFRNHILKAAAAAAGTFLILTVGYHFLIVHDYSIIRPLLIGLVLAAAYFFYLKWSYTKKARKIYQQENFLHKPYTVDFAQDGGISISAEDKVVVPADRVVKIKRNNDLLLAYISLIHMFIVPKRFFATEAEFNDFARKVEARYAKK